MAQALATALAALSKKEVAEKLASGAKDLKGAVDGGLNESLQTLNQLGLNLQPLSAPFQIITAQISAETTQPVLELMGSLMTLLSNETVKSTISGMTDFITALIDTGTDATNAMNELIKSMNDTEYAAKKLSEQLTQLADDMEEQKGYWKTGWENFKTDFNRNWDEYWSNWNFWDALKEWGRNFIGYLKDSGGSDV
jgi:hypothetical protein